MNFFQNNISVLETNRPVLSAQLKAAASVPAFQLMSEIHDKTNIQLNFGEGVSRSYYQNGAEQQAKEFVSGMKFKNPRVLVFLGFGLGTHVDEYIRKPHPLNHTIIIIEPFVQIFRMALECRDFSALLKNPRVKIFLGTDKLQLKMFLANVFAQDGLIRFASAIDVFPLPEAESLSASFFHDFSAILSECLGHQFNHRFSDPYDAYRGLENIIKNMPQLMTMPGMHLAKDLFKGRAGVVVASGPSLTHSLDTLRQIQHKVVIVCCPSALMALHKEGIYPHIWINVERNQDEADYMNSIESPVDHVFVAPPIVRPDCFKQQRAVSTYLLPRVYSKWLPLDGEQIQFGHSSAHAAFAVLNHLGCDRIYLLGQDLSYSEGRSHAEQVWSESQVGMMRQKDKAVYHAEGYTDRPVELNVFWWTYLKTFTEEMFPAYSGKIFNVMPKQFGAKLLGAERLDPEQLLCLLQDDDFDAVAQMKTKLVAASKELVLERQQIFDQRCVEACSMLMQCFEESGAFALKAKAMQFSSELMSYQADKAQPIYNDFTVQFEAFFSRFHLQSSYQSQRFSYENLLFPVLQGFFLKSFVDLYSTASDHDGDVSDMTRKSEIMFQMAKDQAFWADAVRRLISD